MLEGVFINLDRAVERRASMEAQLAALRLPYRVRRFGGVDGYELSGCPAELMPGEYGCWLSHLQVLREAADHTRHLHVMEDDALLGGALAQLDGLVELLKGVDWDLLYLDATLVEIADMCEMFEWTQEARGNNQVVVKPIPRSFTVYGTHSYVVNAQGRERLLNFLDSHRACGKPIDNVLAHGIQTGALRAYLTAPFITSSTNLGLEGAIREGSDDQFLAWMLFRRLCFVDTREEALAGLQTSLAPLARATRRAESVLGALMAYRICRWPNTRFTPAVIPEER